MLGSIVECMEEMVRKEPDGLEIWKGTLRKTGFPSTHKFFSHHVIDDAVVVTMMEHLCEEMKISPDLLAERFGDAWMAYASKAYFAFFSYRKNAKDFLLGMADTHKNITKRINNATPPHFEYEPEPDGSLIMRYHSKRNLAFLWIGLVKAVGRYFNEDLQLERLSENAVRILFLSHKVVE